MNEQRPDPVFKVGARVEAPGFGTYPRMIVAAYEWRDMDAHSAHLRGWWMLCDPDTAYLRDPALVNGRLCLHPSWLVETSAIEQLGRLT